MRISDWSSDVCSSDLMRCYKTGVRGALHDLRSGYPAEHDPDHYEASQARAKALRAIGSDGLVYRSVRHRGGACVAAFYPDPVAVHIQTPHYQYVWAGACLRGVQLGKTACRDRVFAKVLILVGGGSLK